MKKIFFIPLAMLCFKSMAQKDIASKYASLITGAELKKQLTVIASAEFEGRETGTEGQRKAAAYIEGQFSGMNLKKPDALKSYQQLYPLFRDSVQEASLLVNGQPAQQGKDFLVPLQTNESVKFSSSNLVFAGYGIDDAAYNDYAAINVRGKIVVFFLGEPKKDGNYFIDPAGKISGWANQGGLNKKLVTALEKGAVGVLVVNPAQDTFSRRMVDNNIRTNVYFPREDAGAPKKLNYALLSHEYAKSIFPVNFEDAEATAKANGTFNPQPTEGKTRVEYLFRKGATSSMPAT